MWSYRDVSAQCDLRVTSLLLWKLCWWRSWWWLERLSESVSDFLDSGLWWKSRRASVFSSAVAGCSESEITHLWNSNKKLQNWFYNQGANLAFKWFVLRGGVHDKTHMSFNVDDAQSSSLQHIVNGVGADPVHVAFVLAVLHKPEDTRARNELIFLFFVSHRVKMLNNEIQSQGLNQYVNMSSIFITWWL